LKNFINKLAPIIFSFFIAVKYTGSFLPISLTYSLLALLFFGICIFQFSILKKLSKESQFLSLWIVFIFFTLIYSEAFNYGVEKYVVVFSIYFSLFLYVPNMKKDFSKYIKSIFFIFLSISVYLVLFDYSSIQKMVFFGESGGRYRITSDLNSNVISVFFSLGLISSILCTKVFKRGLKIISLFSTILFAVLLFFTGSRGALLSVILAFTVFYLVYKFKKTIKTSFLYLSLIVISLIIGSFIINIAVDFLPTYLDGFINSRYTSEESLASLNARLFLYTLAFQGFSDGNFFDMLFGHGYGSFGYLLTNSDSRGYPHNIFLEILYEMGLLSLFLFLYLIRKIFYYNSKLTKVKLNINQISIFVLFYFLFFNSMSTGDMASNFLLFSIMLVLFESKK
tara:strand:+ start:8430 stop:9614 length:1185 start_codon:yes stop_codon:yes gene_type:complete